jgi:transposase
LPLRLWQRLADGKVFRHERQLSAWLGLVLRQYSSGDKQRLSGISKRGDPYLRMLLIQLARSDVYRCSAKTDPRRDGSQTSRKGWAQRRHVRCANKNARIIWALLAKDEGTGKRPRQIRFYKIAAKMME